MLSAPCAPVMSFSCDFSLDTKLGGLVSAVDQIEQIAEDADIDFDDDDDLDEDHDDD